MLSTVVLAAGLSSGQKLGLAVVAAVFISFALVSAFLIPRYNPNFPGRHVGLYVTVSVLLFAGMISAVTYFGREKEATAAGTTTATTTATATTTTAAKAPHGDPVAGKAVFASAGCVGCHTLKAAGATGTVGPNLDQLKPPYARIVRQVTNGGKIMPKFGGTLSTKQIQDVAAFVYVSTHS
jgi:mono/diheme cytochrome c family protein